MFTFTAQDESDTQRLGRALADGLPPGTVVGLIVQAVATALGVPPGNVTSPTFVLVNEYGGGRMPIYHFDTYRLKDEDEFLELGPSEYFDSDGLVFIEWADRVSGLLPEERLEIIFDVIGAESRRITLIGTTPEMEELVKRISHKFS
jgi:tRNA threonylcarbamoyladenosine biosynthesis protein TsaE